MEKNKFILLKQSFPVSDFDRLCDGYDYIINHVNNNEKTLKKIIKKGEKYLYRVGKENKKFKTMHISLYNFEIIRKKYQIFND